MIRYEDLLQKDDDGFRTDPNLLAPVVVINNTIDLDRWQPTINKDNDKYGVQLTIPASKDLKDGQECLLVIKVGRDQSVYMAAPVNCKPNDSESFTIKNGSSTGTVITTAPNAFTKAVQMLRGMTENSGFENGSAYLFYGCEDGILSELCEVTLDL